jgi:WD40 repeat protein
MASLTGSITGARIWNLSSGKCLGIPLYQRGPVWTLAFDAERRTCLTGGIEDVARLWDVSRGRPSETASPPREDEASDVYFARWAGEETVTVLPHTESVWAVDFAPDGKRLVTAAGKGALCWDPVTAQQVGPLLSHSAEVSLVQVSPDGRTLLTQAGRTLSLWDMAAGRLLDTPLTHEKTGLLSLSADRSSILMGNLNVFQVWDTTTGRPRGPRLVHPAEVRARTWALSPDGKRVVAGDDDGTARMLDAVSGQLLGPPLRNVRPVDTVVFSPEGSLLATGTVARSLRLWRTTTGEPQGPVLPSHRRRVLFSPNGSVLLTEVNLAGQLWETAGGKAMGPPLRPFAMDEVSRFSPDGKLLLVHGSGEVRLWDVAANKPVGPLVRHEGRVNAAAFEPDGRRYVTANSDNKARLWQVPAEMPGDPARVVLELQVLTGMEVDDTGTLRPLAAPAWHERHRRLEELRAAGPP